PSPWPPRRLRRTTPAGCGSGPGSSADEDRFGAPVGGGVACPRPAGRLGARRRPGGPGRAPTPLPSLGAGLPSGPRLRRGLHRAGGRAGSLHPPAGDGRLVRPLLPPPAGLHRPPSPPFGRGQPPHRPAGGVPLCPLRLSREIVAPFGG